MGLKDTGLSNNPVNESEVTPNRELEQPRAGEDSDSDLDETEHWGDYMPLSQNPNDGEALYDLNDESEDDDLNLQEAEVGSANGVTNIPAADLESFDISLIDEVWSKPSPKETDIEMTDKKIDLVKQVMLNIQLPSEAIPAWAKAVPEEDWKNHLLERLNQTDK